MRIRRKVISTVCVVLCAMLLTCACAPTEACDWYLAEFDDGVSIHTDKQQAYLAGDYNAISTYAKGKEELSRPSAVRLSWLANCDGKMAVTAYEVEIEDAGGQYNTVHLTTSEPYVDVYNLCIGTAYLWRVTAHFSDGRSSVSDWSVFSTKDAAPRNLYVDGITNVRDLGGWKTPEGRVRQGMIYRCGRLNESERSDVVIEITQAGIDVMRNILGIRTEIDLRTPDNHNVETGGITSSPLGDDVNYISCPLEWDNGNYLTNNLESVRYFFELASNINNYPLIFHCNIGTDRTGLFALLINGLLGVSEEDLYRDYLFSNFGKINNTRSLSNIKNNYLSTINSCAGVTLSERIENCLLNVVGVPQSQIDAIKTILLELAE